MKKIIISLMIGFCLVLFSNFAFAADCGGAFACSCGDSVVEDTVLDYDLLDCPGDGLWITVNDVTLDCNDSVIQGYGDKGIGISSRSGVTIKNCEVEGFNYGVWLASSSHNHLLTNELHHNLNGVIIYGSSENSLNGNVLRDNIIRGLYVRQSSYNNITNNSFHDNPDYGLQLKESSINNLLWNNSFRDNSVHTYEDSASDSFWNLSNVGNSWDELNPGFPDYYEINGPGDGIDWYPDWDFEAECAGLIIEDTILTEDLHNCPGDGLTIYSDNITLDCDGHVIDGASSGIGILNVHYDNITIKNCRVEEFSQGIRLEEVSGNNVYGNNVSFNRNAGIVLHNADSNNIFDNYITENNGNNGDGLVISYSNYNNVYRNNIISNEARGVSVLSSTVNNFWNNSLISNLLNAYEDSGSNGNYWNYSNIGNWWDDFVSNPGYPNDYYVGGPGDGVDYFPNGEGPAGCGSTITEDTILTEDLLDCPDHGLIIGADNITLDCDNHTISGQHGDLIRGIVVINRQNVTIKNCNIYDFYSGIFLWQGLSDDNTIYNNYIDADVHGILLEDGCERNTIYDNTLTSSEYGIALLTDSANNTIFNNIFTNNTDNAYESGDSNGNNWNLSETGNNWDDFESNPGWPYNYEIPGLGDGIDWWPYGKPTEWFDKYFYAGYGFNLPDDYYDNVSGGGACNVFGGCDSTDTEDNASCIGENYCVLDGTCYPGDASVVMDIDGLQQHDAICVGFGWYDCDTGLPGMEVCEEFCGYNWVEAGEVGVGEYEWNYNDFGCCGDDYMEHYICNTDFPEVCACCNGEFDIVDMYGNCVYTKEPVKKMKVIKK